MAGTAAEPCTAASCERFPPSLCPDPRSLLQKELLGIQQLLNSSETSLHQLTAMLDCRGLHKVRSCPSALLGRGVMPPGGA